jgi:hypothetical protein
VRLTKYGRVKTISNSCAFYVAYFQLIFQLGITTGKIMYAEYFIVCRVFFHGYSANKPVDTQQRKGIQQNNLCRVLHSANKKHSDQDAPLPSDFYKTLDKQLKSNKMRPFIWIFKTKFHPLVLMFYLHTRYMTT